VAAEFRERIRVDEAGIEWVGVIPRRRVPWREVARRTHNPVNHWFLLTAASGAHVWLWDDLHGIVDFAEMALRCSPPRC